MHRLTASKSCYVALLGAWVLPRVLGVLTDFWLDEIWALDIVGRIDSPLDVFTRIHFDTNHWLYSLLLFFIGPREDWIAYRLPALAAGIATLPMMVALARREGNLEATIALLLAGSSFLLIEYSSEARGYAPAVLFSLGAFYALGRQLESGRVSWAAAFNALCILGLLSHLTFLFPYAGLLAWSVAAALVRPTRPAAALRRIASCHALPLLFFLGLYVVDIRHIQHGAGPESPIASIVGRLSALTLGLPETGVFPAVAIAVCAGIAVAGIWRLRRDPSRRWVFYAITLLLAPACVVVARGREFPFWSERHFLVCVPFLLLLLARLLVHVANSGRRGRAAAILFVALYVTGNSVRTFDFLRFGRGQYREAVEYMFAHSTEPAVTVGSDHDFRNSMLLTYYSRFAPKERQLVYVGEDAWPREGPRWLILHSTDEDRVAEPQYVFADRVEYRLAKQFPFSGVSGWRWDLYERRDD